MSSSSSDSTASSSSSPSVGIGGLPLQGTLSSYYPSNTPFLPSSSLQYLGEKTPKPRSFADRLAFEMGTCYITGIIGGGFVGGVQGLLNPRGTTFKLRANSILNASSKAGSSTGNSFAVFALIYSMTRDIFRQYVRENDDVVNESIGAFTAGTLVAKGNKFSFPLSITAGTAIMSLTWLGFQLKKKLDPEGAEKMVQLPPMMPTPRPQQR